MELLPPKQMSNGSPGLPNDKALPMIIFLFACMMDVTKCIAFCRSNLTLLPTSLANSAFGSLPLGSISRKVCKATGMFEFCNAACPRAPTATYASKISCTFSASVDGVTTSVENNNLSRGMPSCCFALLYGSSSHLN